MKKILVATAFLVGTTAFAIAQSNTGGGASTMSPGHEMQNPSASGSTSRGASEYSPGDRMNDAKEPADSRAAQRRVRPNIPPATACMTGIQRIGASLG